MFLFATSVKRHPLHSLIWPLPPSHLLLRNSRQAQGSDTVPRHHSTQHSTRLVATAATSTPPYHPPTTHRDKQGGILQLRPSPGHRVNSHKAINAARMCVRMATRQSQSDWVEEQGKQHRRVQRLKGARWVGRTCVRITPITPRRTEDAIVS